VARLVTLTFIQDRPSLLHNLNIDQAATHLGLGSLYQDQHSLEKASDQLIKVYYLTEALIRTADSPGLQDKLGVILMTQGEILNKQGQLHTTSLINLVETRTALGKQQRAIKIVRQLEKTTTGPLWELTLRRLMESLISMTDTLELLELYEQSQIAMLEAQGIGKRAQKENITSPLHLHQQTCACTKATMSARKELDDHTSTLHVGSKMLLYGLLNQTLNGKKGSVLRMASINWLVIQLQEDHQQVSIRISNIQYWVDPEQNCLTLYKGMVAKAHIEIELLKAEVKTQKKKSGKKNINMALAQYNLGSALWLSNKPHETTLAEKEFAVIIMFMTQREPNHSLLSESMKI